MHFIRDRIARTAPGVGRLATSHAGHAPIEGAIEENIMNTFRIVEWTIAILDQRRADVPALHADNGEHFYSREATIEKIVAYYEDK